MLRGTRNQSFRICILLPVFQLIRGSLAQAPSFSEFPFLRHYIGGHTTDLTSFRGWRWGLHEMLWDILEMLRHYPQTGTVITGTRKELDIEADAFFKACHWCSARKLEIQCPSNTSFEIAVFDHFSAGLCLLAVPGLLSGFVPTQEHKEGTYLWMAEPHKKWSFSVGEVAGIAKAHLGISEGWVDWCSVPKAQKLRCMIHHEVSQL